MNKEKGLLNGKFSFKALPDGSLDKIKVICIYCWCELRSHQSMMSIKYYLLAKHTADAESPSPPLHKQTMLDSLQQRLEDNSASNKLL